MINNSRWNFQPWRKNTTKVPCATSSTVCILEHNAESVLLTTAHALSYYQLIHWARFLQVIWPNQQCQSTEENHAVGLADKAWIPPGPLHHVTIIQLWATASTHGVRVPMWQTQSAGPVRTAHMSVQLTVNIVSHNPAQSSSDNIPS